MTNQTTQAFQLTDEIQMYLSHYDTYIAILLVKWDKDYHLEQNIPTKHGKQMRNEILIDKQNITDVGLIAFKFMDEINAIWDQFKAIIHTFIPQ